MRYPVRTHGLYASVRADTSRGGVSMAWTVGIMSPGDMGSGIGEKLAKNGARVIVALDARSERTKALAAEAGLEDVGSVERLVQEASHVLSVMVPSEAVGAAERVA